MAATSAFQFSLEMSTDAAPSRTLGRFAVPSDVWALPSRVRAVQRILRVIAADHVFLSTGPATIDPIWDPLLNEPYLVGFRMWVAEPNDGPSASCDFTTDYFATLAEQLGSALIAAKPHWPKEGLSICGGRVCPTGICPTGRRIRA